jgi:tetratricopeptide (TPR) repeat protein
MAFSQEGEEKSLIGFANHLFERGHYYQAVTEYERFIYFNPNHPSVPNALLKIAFCYKLGEQYDKAIELFRNLVDEYHNQEVGGKAAYQVGECYLESGDYELALIEFENFIEDNPNHLLTEKAKWEMAWTYIYLEEYSSAEKRLFLIKKDSLYQKPSQELAGALKQLPHLPRKSPLMAGVLAAVIPGAGHFYMGKKKQAVFAFITNALLFYGAYEAFASEIYAVGGLVSFFSLNYYSGNIFGALNSAHKFNKNVREEYLEGFRRKYNLSINLKGGKEGPMLELALNF